MSENTDVLVLNKFARKFMGELSSPLRSRWQYGKISLYSGKIEAQSYSFTALHQAVKASNQTTRDARGDSHQVRLFSMKFIDLLAKWVFSPVT